METILAYAVLFLFLELFEVWWQKAPTLYGIVERIYSLYHKSIFLVLLLHPTLYLSVFIMIKSDYALASQLLFSLKLSDIALKLIFVKKVFLDKHVAPEFEAMLQMEIEPYMLYAGAVLYPVLVFLSF